MQNLKYCTRNEWWKRQIKKKSLICKNVFPLAWGGFWLVRSRVNANNGRWKHILQINSSMCIKKVMWLCAMGWYNWTKQQTDLHLKCYDHSEMPEQSLSSKYFCIFACQNCLTQLRIYCVSSWCASNLLFKKIIIFSGFSYFLSDI